MSAVTNAAITLLSLKILQLNLSELYINRKITSNPGTLVSVRGLCNIDFVAQRSFSFFAYFLDLSYVPGREVRPEDSNPRCGVTLEAEIFRNQSGKWNLCHLSPLGFHLFLPLEQKLSS